jgi:hypothetical protein
MKKNWTSRLNSTASTNSQIILFSKERLGKLKTIG